MNDITAAAVSTDRNPLLDFSGLPRFASIRAQHIAPAVQALLSENRSIIVGLASPLTPATWDRFVHPLEDANERLSRAWGVASHLHAADDSPEIRQAYNACLPGITQYWIELAQNLALYEKYKTLRASAEYVTLSAAQQRIVDNELRDFRLGGAELPAPDQRRFGKVQEEIASLSARFSEHLLDATNAYTVEVLSEGELRGIPADVLHAAHELSASAGGGGWKFTLHAPSYVPLMQYAENRDLRESMYRAFVTRASEFGPSELDNTDIITRLLELKREASQLLGYRNHAEVSLEPKMAESPAAVIQFLEGLAEKALPHARKDYAELADFARDELGLDRLEAWDLAYASEKLRARRYSFSEDEAKQYFVESRVLEGMFAVASTLFGIRIEPATAETWHPDVTYLRILDASGGMVGGFYLDLYARDTKRGGAWMDEAVARRRRGDQIQAPVAYLICNFSRPVGRSDGHPRPALFTHDEVITLFHEFGHGLHHLLTRVDYLGVSGIRGVEWDAVELPSQFMENFCWEWEVLRRMTAHVDSGEPLPRTLFDKMVAARNFQNGMQMVRQLEFSLFDMHLHYDYSPGNGGAQTPLELLGRIRAKVAVATVPSFNRFPNTFSHIFSGGYSAGYYSYKWAEVLSADAYSMFEENRAAENGILDPGTGARFRDEILAAGGSRPAMESFRAFRGREPRIDALLRHNGMIDR